MSIFQTNLKVLISLISIVILNGCSDTNSSNKAIPPSSSNVIEWQTVKISDSVTVQIPTSPLWYKYGFIKTPPYEITKYEDGDLRIYFGKYISDDGYYLSPSRQYTLSFYDKKPGALMGDEIKENACGEDIDEQGNVIIHLTPPEKVKVAGISGVSYLAGGFGACATLFNYQSGENYITLFKRYPFGSYDPKHIITPDMVEIISKITVINSQNKSTLTQSP